MINRYKIEVEANSQDFINYLIKNKINIYDINIIGNKTQIIIDKKDYQLLNSNIKIVNKYGLSKLQTLINKYRLFIIFFLLSILINIFFSNIILSINIKNTNKHLVKQVEKTLKQEGLSKYHFIMSSKRLSHIKKKLLLNKNIEWVEIKRIGTKYEINIEQRKFPKKEEKTYPRNIVAKKNAIIYKMNVIEGEIIKKKNDYVAKGETIVSGLIHNKETIKSKIPATGKIYGKTWYHLKISLPLSNTSYKETGKTSLGIFIKTPKNNYNLLNKFVNYKKYQYNIVDSNIVPINISIVKYKETKKISKRLSNKNINNKAISLVYKEMNKRLHKGEKILDKKILKKTINNSRIDIEMFIVAKEDITDYFDISNIDINKINEKVGD